GKQILSKPCRSQPFEPLNAVGDHAFPAREKPAAGDVQPEDGDATKALTTTGTTGSQAPPTERGSKAIGHDPAATTKSLAGTPDVGPPDAVNDNVDALARQAVNFFHEVEMLVIKRDTAQVGNGRRPSRRTGTVHLQPGEAPKLQERRADPACRAVNQHALARFDLSGAIQHLVRRDVVQHEADSLGGVQPRWHRADRQRIVELGGSFVRHRITPLNAFGNRPRARGQGWVSGSAGWSASAWGRGR